MKTACPKGHPYALHACEDSEGVRRCRLCNNASQRASRARKHPPRSKYPQHCVRCDNRWESSTQFPDKCPACNVFQYDVPVGFTSPNLLQHVKPPRGNWASGSWAPTE